MPLEEKLRGLAGQGELVHLSVAFSNGAYHCNLAAATPASGYVRAADQDPVTAVEKAIAELGIRPKRQAPGVPTSPEVTAAVNAPPAPARRQGPSMEQWTK